MTCVSIYVCVCGCACVCLSACACIYNACNLSARKTATKSKHFTVVHLFRSSVFNLTPSFSLSHFMLLFFPVVGDIFFSVWCRLSPSAHATTRIWFGKTESCPFCANCNCRPTLYRLPVGIEHTFAALLCFPLSLSISAYSQSSHNCSHSHSLSSPASSIKMHSHAFAALALFDSFSLALLHSLSVYLSCTWLSSWQDIHFRALCVHLNEAGAANGPTDTRTPLQAVSQLPLPLFLFLPLTWLVINSTCQCVLRAWAPETTSNEKSFNIQNGNLRNKWQVRQLPTKMKKKSKKQLKKQEAEATRTFGANYV